MRARALAAGGLLGWALVVTASGYANATAGTTAGCSAAASDAIHARQRLTAVPAVCRPLSLAQRNTAAALAIRTAAGTGPKSQWRKQAGAAARYVTALITGPAPVAAAGAGTGAGTGTGTAPPATSAPAGSRLGFSERAAEIAALAAWLATAGSGGWILGRWWRAGGRPGRLRGSYLVRALDPAAPPVVIVGHVSLGLLGLAVWALFMATGWAALAWVALGVLCPVAGLGMTVLLSGLPRPPPGTPGARAAGAGLSAGSPGQPKPNPRPRGGTATLAPTPTPAPPAPSAPPKARPGRQPVVVIAAHGLFVLATLLLVLLAAIGA